MSGLKKKWSQIFHFEDDSDGGGGGGGFALISTALSGILRNSSIKHR